MPEHFPCSISSVATGRRSGSGTGPDDGGREIARVAGALQTGGPVGLDGAVIGRCRSNCMVIQLCKGFLQ